MFIFRTGLLLATLLLSACSTPITTESTQVKKKQVENTQLTETGNLVVQNTPTKDVSVPQKNASHKEALVQLEAQKKLAEANYAELKKRIGKVDELPAVNMESANIDSMIQQLRNYTSKTDTDIASLNTRINERQKLAINGDLIHIFLSEATITYKDALFRAQPLVGQWVRGETRVIRLKENILFENSQSEDLHITYSETYLLIVNDKIIGTINPNKEKNSASFTVSTQDNRGTITGKLDYRIVKNQ